MFRLCPCRLLSRPLPLQFRPLTPSRHIRTSVLRRSPIDDSDDNVDDLEADALPDRLSPTSLRELAAPERDSDERDSNRDEDDVSQGPRSSQTQTLEDIDSRMSVADLGLKNMARKRKREFIRWSIQEGNKYEHFPWHVTHEIEERRLRRRRKETEERMFFKMRVFWDSLTMEEIVEFKLGKKRPKRRMGKEEYALWREKLPSPTPLEQLLDGDADIGLTKIEVESRALKLLQRYDQEVHVQYRNYIEYTDYELQKMRLWFSFPDTPDYAAVVSRLRGPPEDAEPSPNDLATYFGPVLSDDVEYPIMPIEKSHYIHSLAEHPFTMNPTFRPWRPLPHEMRLRMFDAWREGLGLRNVAWLGGVSWRRVDGIIGILKKEWEFVQKVTFPLRVVFHDESLD
jgi:hypothetical protein